MIDDFIPYQEIAHTADIGLRVRGRSLEELFTNAARGMLWLMGWASDDHAEAEAETIEIQGLDVEHLLVRWLSEVLYLFREGRALVSCVFLSLTPDHLRSRCRMAKLLPGFVCRKEIKLVTYHRLRLECREGIYTCDIIFDV